MTSFNPYHEWLELDAALARPNHYELFGLANFEPDTRKIVHAADRALAQVRACRPGKQAKAWAALLDELRGAKQCLSKADTKSSYDATLRKQLEQPAAPAAENSGVSVAAVNTSADLFPPGMGPTQAADPEKTPVAAATRESPPPGRQATPGSRRDRPGSRSSSNKGPAEPKADTAAKSRRAAKSAAVKARSTGSPGNPAAPAAKPDGSGDSPAAHVDSAALDPMAPLDPEALKAEALKAAQARSETPSTPPSDPAMAQRPGTGAAAIAERRKAERRQFIWTVTGISGVLILLTVGVLFWALRDKGSGSQAVGPPLPSGPVVPAPGSDVVPLPETDGDEGTTIPDNAPDEEDPPAENPGSDPDTEVNPGVAENNGEDTPPDTPPDEPVIPVETTMPTAVELLELQQSLVAAREAVKERDFDRAQTELAAARSVARLPDHVALVDRAEQFVEHVREFTGQLQQAIASLQGGQQIPVGTTFVGVVQVGADELVLRVAGTNRPYPIAELPPGLAVAIVETRLDPEDPNTKLLKGAYVATLAEPTDQQMERVRTWWSEAELAGADGASLLQYLEDDYSALSPEDAE